VRFLGRAYLENVDKTVVLFDGVCNLCNSTVQFIIQHDPDGQFRFASQQSGAGQKLLAQQGIPASNALADSVVVIEGSRVWLESDAALHILYRLGGIWSFAYIFRWLPKPFRDGLYRWVARNRYRIFGRRKVCMVPTPELRGRFL